MNDGILRLYTADEPQDKRKKAKTMIKELSENENIPQSIKEELRKLYTMLSDEEYDRFSETFGDTDKEMDIILEELEMLYHLTDDIDTEDSMEEGEFGAYVILSKSITDSNALWKNIAMTLKEQWNIEVQNIDSDTELYITQDGNTVEIHLEDAVIPPELIEMSRDVNYMISDDEEEQPYQSTIVILSSEDYENTVALAQLFVKVVSACAMQENVTGVLQNSVMYETEYYIKSADVMKQGILPMENLLWVHIMADDDAKTITAWSTGLECFGRKEIEIIHSKKQPLKVVEFVMNVANYLLSENVDFEDGETIEWSSDEQFTVTFSDGIYKTTNTMKINYYTD